jgi:hypothetical protein
MMSKTTIEKFSRGLIIASVSLTLILLALLIKGG